MWLTHTHTHNKRYLISIWPFRINTCMENHILHVCQSENYVKEKFCPVLTLDSNYRVIVIRPIHYSHFWSTFLINILLLLINSFIIPISKHHLMKPSLSMVNFFSDYAAR
ncbi:hypothetical protein V8G54_001858, partial [Vigna mungo]